jgi:hypothetical protein
MIENKKAKKMTLIPADCLGPIGQILLAQVSLLISSGGKVA